MRTSLRSIALALTLAALPGPAWAGTAADTAGAEGAARKARSLLAAGSAAEARAIADQVIDAGEAVPAKTRKGALDVAYRASVALKDLDGEARYALLSSALLSASEPAARRRYQRPAWVDAVCGRYEKKHGAGTCALLALKLTGEPNLPDHSGAKVAQVVADADVERANQDYLPLVADCVGSAAHADPDLFESGTIRVSWAIDPDGRAIDAEISPRRFRDALRPCVEERLSWFRYPRSRSKELKAVSISYELSTVWKSELVSTP